MLPEEPEEPAGAKSSSPGDAQLNDAEAGGSVYAVSHGDMHIRNAYPVYRVEPFPLESAQVSRAWPLSRLLAAESKLVPFSGRAKELADLAAWRDAPMAGVSVLLLHGPGGQGKTRLAGRFAELSYADGWTVWAAHHLSDPTALTQVAIDPPDDQLVLIADYADRWPQDDLLLLLRNPLLTRPRRTRLLLVARTQGIWWPTLRHRLGKSVGMVAGAIELGPLAVTNAERLAAFAAARDRFAARDLFDIAEPASILPPREIAGDAYDLVLTVHMAALAAADAQVRGVTPPSDPANLSAYLLDREHDHWQSLYDHGQVGIEPTIMARMVYAATLTGPLSRHRATEVLRRALLVGAEDAARLVDEHAVCYPPITGIAEHAFRPLYPDRLGEDFIALRSPGHWHPGYQADMWASDALVRIAAPAGAGAALPWTQAAVATLISAAARWRHLGHAHLFPLLRRYPGLGQIAGGTALAELAWSPDIDRATLNAIYDIRPSHGHADTGAGFAEIAQRLNTLLPAGTPLQQRMSAYRELAWQLWDTGHFEADPAYILRAADAIDEALALGRAELRRNPADSKLRDFLATIEPVSAAYRSAVGDVAILRETQALRAHTLMSDGLSRGAGGSGIDKVMQGVVLFRRLELADPNTYRPKLAEALLALGNLWSIAGWDEEALEAATEGADLLRSPQPRSDGERLHYAQALLHRSTRLAALARIEEAVAAAREAVAAGQALAAESPDRYTRDLGVALTFLARRLVDQGSYGEALAAATRAVSTARDQEAADASAGASELVKALEAQGLALSGLGDTSAALAATREAADLSGRADVSGRADDGLAALALREFAAVRLAAGAELLEAKRAAIRSTQLLDQTHDHRATVSRVDRVSAHETLGAIRRALNEDMPTAQQPAEDTKADPVDSAAFSSTRAAGPIAAEFLATGVLHCAVAACAYELGAEAVSLMMSVVGIAALTTASLVAARSPYAKAAARVVRVCWDRLGVLAVLAVIIGSWHASWLHHISTLSLMGFGLLGAAITARSATRRQLL